MASISSIKLPSGITYNLKDNGALQLTGGQVTGPVTFGDTISVDDATIGNLVINGAASFTNNIQANTINGIAVGGSPKFTDTITTVTTTGTGNAITAISATNGAITATKGATFLTSYTETDPVFSASAAAGITTTDISNWNDKADIYDITTGVGDSSNGTAFTIRLGNYYGNYEYTNFMVFVNKTQTINSIVQISTTTNGKRLDISKSQITIDGQTNSNYINSGLYYGTLSAWSNSATLTLTSAPKMTNIPTIPTNVSAFTNDAGYLTSYTETDPTVPAWAKAATKPTYTATEVGAMSTSHAANAITSNDISNWNKKGFHIVEIEACEDEALDGYYTSGDITCTMIKNWIDNKEVVILKYSTYYYYFMEYDRGTPDLFFINNLYDFAQSIIIPHRYNNDYTNIWEISRASLNDVLPVYDETVVEDGEGSAAGLMVLNETAIESAGGFEYHILDKTAAEVYNAFMQGRVIVVYFSEQIYLNLLNFNIISADENDGYDIKAYCYNNYVSEGVSIKTVLGDEFESATSYLNHLYFTISGLL